MPLPNSNLPNARRIATARAALTTAMAVRADCPIISDDAVIEISLSEIEQAARISGLTVHRDALFVPTKTISAYAREARARSGIEA
jgi:hypothetical protein